MNKYVEVSRNRSTKYILKHFRKLKTTLININYHLHIVEISLILHGRFNISSVQSLSRVQFFVTTWTTARRASLSITNSQSLLKLMSIESLMPSNHLILCHPRRLAPSICPSIRAFSNEWVLWFRWSKYWGFSFKISPSNEHSVLLSFRMDWLNLCEV